MPFWACRILRIIGVGHIALGLGGLSLSAWAVFHFAHRSLDPRDPLYFTHAYSVMTAISVFCTLTLTVAGIALLRVERLGFIMSNLLFSFEILYFLSYACISAFTSTGNNQFWLEVDRSAAAAFGMGNLAFTPQILTAYPVIALILLNVVWRKARAARQ